MMHKILAVLPLMGALVVAPAPASSQSTSTVGQDTFPATWDVSHAGAALNISNYTMAFSDEFNTLDAGCYQWVRAIGPHKWYSSNNDSDGLAVGKCASASPSPFKVTSGVLGITASKVNGVWQSGSLATVDPASEGFQQKNGYFEARIKLPSAIPAGLDVWPAFWLQGRFTLPGTAYNYTEVDIMESWGQIGRSNYQVTMHQWPAKPANLTSLLTHRQAGLRVNKSIYDDQWHTYGLKMSPTLWISYKDGVEVGRFPMVGSDMQKPLYPLVNLAIATTPTASATASYTMYVDYVHVYACPTSGCT